MDKSTTIHVLFRDGVITLAVHDTCANSGIATIADIEKYFLKSKALSNNFSLFDERSTKSLVQLLNNINQEDQCSFPGNTKVHLNTKFPEENRIEYHPDEDLYPIMKSGGISVRAYNVCQQLNIRTLRELKKYYTKNGDLNNSHKFCGRATNAELVSLIHTIFKNEELQFSEHPEKRLKLNAKNTIESDSPNNKTIRALHKREEISARAYNVCQSGDIYTISDLQKFFNQHGNFNSLRNCGKRTSMELKELLNKYYVVTEIDADSSSDSMPSFLKRGEISVRSYNICQDGDIFTLSDLQKIFNQFGNFYSIKSCGKRTNMELEELIYKHYVPTEEISIAEIKNPNQEDNKESPQLEKLVGCREIVDKLTDIQSRHLGYLISDRVMECRDETRANILKICDNDVSLTSVINKLMAISDRTLNSFAEFNNQSIYDIRQVIYSIYKIIEATNNNAIISTSEDILIKFLQTEYFIDGDDSKLIKDLMIELNRAPFFQIVNRIIMRKDFFTPTERLILNNSYGFINTHSNLTLEDIGKEVGLTRERIRQIKTKLIGKFRFLNDIIQKLNISISEYGISTADSVIIIDKEMGNDINSREKVDFSLDFYSFIFSVLLKDTHKLFLLENKFGQRHRANMKCRYYLSNEILKVFKFEQAFFDFRKAIEPSGHACQNLKLVEVLPALDDCKDKELLNRILPVLAEILKGEFNIEFNNEYEFNMPENDTSSEQQLTLKFGS